MSVTQRVSQLESIMAQLAYAQMKTEMVVQNLANEMKEFKDEMKDFKNSVNEFNSNMNKKWGELANRMGTIVADLIYPNLPHLLQKTFSLEEPRNVATNIKRKLKEKNLQGEVDMIVEFEQMVFINETKSSLNAEYIDKFRWFMDEKFHLLFPEFNNKKVVPVMSSLNIDEKLIPKLTEYKIFAVHVFGDILTIKNLDEVRGEYGL